MTLDKPTLIRLTQFARDHARKSNASRAKESLGTLRKELTATQEHNARFKSWYSAR
ncbi:hypothetical protein [Verrucomicrobium sp. BvORR106]|uniref:hypothetical protein n=1 Tax=Verrucomicrobium sp. BvORR106 TaxID=1403819 RepID=UPI000B27F836|nr:hypothetical protein [Verrucomicrobium sp. BvORR106]